MYEAHFGLKASPFSLNPDPEYFFGSRDHAHALAYLRYGVYQSEGFVVVTGEIGAGKTTLVRTLLSELDQEKIVAAQIVSTQLEANDLLRSVALAFGIAPKSLTKAELIATIEAYLTVLVTQGKRALLIIDEAQNLNREAVEELRMLSNFQFGSRSLMQSFLVGQPELRALLTSKPMEQFRQRVIASCHVGPMSCEETQRYIEHRLKMAEWSGNPAIEPEAFEEIYRATEGIPRRVNLLCNRLLLAAYLESATAIGAADVSRTVAEVRAELGVSMELAPPPSDLVPAAEEPAAAAPIEQATLPITLQAPVAIPSVVPGDAPIVFVAGDRQEDIQLSALMRAFFGARAGVPSMLRLRIAAQDTLPGDVAFAEQLSGEVPTLSIPAPEGSPASRVAAAMMHVERVLVEQRAVACVVCGSSEVALGAALAAELAGCLVVHANAGVRRARGTRAAMIDRIARVHFAADRSAFFNLIREGTDESRVHLGQSLFGAALRDASAVPMVKRAALKQAGAPISLADGKRGYALVLTDGAGATRDRAGLKALLDDVAKACGDLPVVWTMPAELRAAIEAAGLSIDAAVERVTVLPPLEFAHTISLLRCASLVTTDVPDARSWAATLGVRCSFVGSAEAAQEPVASTEADDDALRAFADLVVSCLPTEQAAAADRSVA